MKDRYIGIGRGTDGNIPVSGGTSRGFSQYYVGNGENYYLVSTNNHTAVLKNNMTGQTVNVWIHSESEGTLTDGSNLYYPDN